MRIALCLEYPIALRGGVSVLVEALLEEFVRRGHQVVLVSADTAETLRASPAGKLVAEHFAWNRLKPSAAAAKKLARQLAGARVDLAHFHSGGNYGWGNRFPFRSPIFFLNNLEMLGPSMRINASENLSAGGATYMPTIKVREFTFSSLSDAV